MPGGTLTPCPLVVALHGRELQSVHSITMHFPRCTDELGVVTIIPHLPDEIDDDGISLRSAIAFTDDFSTKRLRPLVIEIMNRHADMIDPKRVYLIGQSLGGTGAFVEAIRSPDLFHKIFALSPLNFCFEEKRPPYYDFDEDTKLAFEHRRLATALQKVEFWQGGQDSCPENWRLMPSTFEQYGVHVNVSITFFPDLSHMETIRAAWAQVYDEVWKGNQHIE